jgi:predicted nucleotidyltransferase
MTTYEATVTRGERYWVIYVPAIDRYTQARHLRELEAMTADLIEVMTGARPEEIRYDIQLPDDVVKHLKSAERLRAMAAAAQSDAAAEVRAAARTLHSAGVPLRDVGRVLGVSYQRAHQLAQSA